MSLKAWLEQGALRAHKPSRKEIAGLLTLADRNLADARVAALSAEGRFQFAYNAALAERLRREVEAWVRAQHPGLL